MRGKLEQPRGLIELISVEVERIDCEYQELWVSYEYTCPGGQYKSAMVLPINNSREMTNVFFKELISEARNLSEIDRSDICGIGLNVSNKINSMLPIKNLCQRVIDVLGSDNPLNENKEFIDLCTSGFHFKVATDSLSSKDFEERFKIFMSRAKEKIAQGYYTIAADDLEKANILCSTSPLIYKLIGICHRELGHLDLAFDMFSKAMDLGDKERDTYLYLAEINFFMNNMEQAQEILEKMLKEYPEDIRAMVELANIRYQMGGDYINIMDKAFSLDKNATQKTILQTFVFKKVGGGKQKKTSLKAASTLLEIPEHTIRLLALNNRIPARTYSDHDELILDEHELRSWAFVYRRYDLFEDEIERVSANPGGDKHQGMALLS
ncbi:MAG: tetratricopeptide repeat protein [Deltaproteobacteria bacterium]|nr:tetratricopeptide repeat protein [Deltaproteobacteria bacterium]